MRAGSAHENRFASIPSKTAQNQKHPCDFGKQAQRNIDFTMPVHCRNLYTVKQGHQKSPVGLSKSLGRDKGIRRDCYLKAGQGSAHEIPLGGQELKLKSNLGHIKK